MAAPHRRVQRLPALLEFRLDFLSLAAPGQLPTRGFLPLFPSFSPAKITCWLNVAVRTWTAPASHSSSIKYVASQSLPSSFFITESEWYLVLKLKRKKTPKCNLFWCAFNLPFRWLVWVVNLSCDAYPLVIDLDNHVHVTSLTTINNCR